MGLFDFLKMKSLPVDTPTNEKHENWQKDLSIALTLKEEIKPLEDLFVECACELQKRQLVDDEILLLQKLIKHYEEAKRKCYLLGPDYIDYFNRSWDEVRKNKEDGPSYVTRYQKRLQHIKENYKELKEMEKQYQEQGKDLEKRLISYLRENAPVLQSDIYKSFGPLVKNDIRDLLYHMEKSGKIDREKSGRNYTVTLK